MIWFYGMVWAALTVFMPEAGTVLAFGCLCVWIVLATTDESGK